MRAVQWWKKRKQSIYITFHNIKGLVPQDTVVASVKDILEHEFIDCGYRLMTSYLNRDGYVINPKKLYKILKEEGLSKLDNRIDRSDSGHKFVKFRKVCTTRPLECLGMDIKMAWIPNVGKNAYLPSVIDVHTRRILKDYFSFNIKQNQVIALISVLFENYYYPGSVIIRSDNGSQFIARKVREYLGLIGV